MHCATFIFTPHFSDYRSRLNLTCSFYAPVWISRRQGSDVNRLLCCVPLGKEEQKSVTTPRTEDTILGKAIPVYDGQDIDVRNKGNWNDPGGTLRQVFRSTVLPSGFPSTVDEAYLPFSTCNVLRQLFRSAYYVLGTSSLLVALSTDTGSSLTLSAALTWALKDGLGLAAKAGLSSTLGPRADAEPKRARLIGELLMVFAGAAEACSLLRPSAFLPLATLAGALRQGGDALSGPSYRVFLDALAISRNIGDVSAKAEAQVVFGKLLGLGLGAAVVAGLAAVPPDPNIRLPATGTAFAILAACHLAVARMQVSAVSLRTLNAQRLHLILDHYLNTCSVPSVNHVNAMERVVYLGGNASQTGAGAIDFGVALPVSNADGTTTVPCKTRYFLGETGPCIGIALREDASVDDMLISALHARRLLQNHKNDRWSIEAMQTSQQWVGNNFEDFQNQLRAQGWDTSRLLFPIGRNRYRLEDQESV